MVERINDYFSAKRIALYALIINVLFVFYAGLIQNNDLKNLVKEHEKKFQLIDIQIQKLDDKKVDKTLMDNLIQNQIEIKQSLNLMNSLLIKHITGINN